MSPGGSGKALGRPIRLAVAGGSRGSAILPFVELLKEKVELAAVCDPDESVRARWRQRIPSIAEYGRFEELLDDDGVDAVYVATPMAFHADQSVAAMERGKDVLCEVPAAVTLEECWRLVETVRATGRTFMMSENYCYSRECMMVAHMAGQGCFGAITHAEGGYIQDCRSLTHRPDGTLTWRGEVHRTSNCSSYPTHALGPVMQWLGADDAGGDRLVELVSMASRPRSLAHYYRQQFGEDHPGASEGYWLHGDSQVTLIGTERGAVIYLRVDWTSARPINGQHYALQGVKGAYLSARHWNEEPLVWLEEEPALAGSVTGSGAAPTLNHPRWSTLWSYAPLYEHPRWRSYGAHAAYMDHRWWDFFLLSDFADAARTGAKPPIDVAMAATLSSLLPLTAKSLKARGGSVEIPDFRAAWLGGDSKRR